MIGRIVGNYKIVEALGEGGVGMVYKGVDTMLDREVAIKVLRPELASQTSVVERFRSEAVTLAKLNHPNIATLYSLFREGQDLLMVLEFLKGETLDHTLYRRGRIPTDEAIPIFCQGLEGINYAHKLGIVHRDIKPGNMMLTDEGILKVLDFGIARLLGSNRMTRVGNVIGTLEYMSPEQVRGHETDARSDVYGMGMMLYEMLTGRLPFESENDFALMKMQTENIPIPPRQLNPEIPIEIENAILKSVAKDPNERFQSAGDFLEYFLEIGFSIPNKTLGFSTMYGRKNSRPSNPGISSEPVSNSETLQLGNYIDNFTLPLANIDNSTLPLINVEPPTLPPSQIPTVAINLASQAPITLEIKEEIKKEKIAETRLAQNQAEIKGTRLATPITPVQNELKATRLGTIQTGQNNSAVENEESSSIFSKLNWIHYAGAGVIFLLFFSIVAVAGIYTLTSFGTETPAKVEQKPAGNQINNSTTPTPINQPIAKEEPANPPSQDGGGTMPTVPTDSSIATNTNSAIPIGTPEPNNVEKNAPQQPVQKQPKEKDTARSNPPPVKQQPKPQPPANPVRKAESGSKAEAREVMTNPTKRKVDN